MSEYPWSSDEDNALLTTAVSRDAHRSGTTETQGTSGRAVTWSAVAAEAAAATSTLPSSWRDRMRFRSLNTTETSRNNPPSLMLSGTRSYGPNYNAAALAQHTVLAVACARDNPTSSRTSENAIPVRKKTASVIRSGRLNRPMNTANLLGNSTSSRIRNPVRRNAAAASRSSRLSRPLDTTNLLDRMNNLLSSTALFASTGAASGVSRSHPSSPQLSGVARSDGETSVVVAENLTTARNENNVEQENVEDIGGTTTAALEVSLEEILEIDPAPEVNNSNEESNVELNVTDVATISNAENTVNESPRNVTEESQHRGTKRKIDGSGDESQTELNQKLLSLLECLVCLEWLEPPMGQCRRGHLVCAACRARLAACPVCRTAFSSMRNRAMEGVAELVRYPCRHGCGSMVRLRRRSSHEASCTARHYRCAAPACNTPPLPLEQLITHVEVVHTEILKVGNRHKFSLLINNELREDWLVLAMSQLFHLCIKVDVNSWSLVVYVTYIGPKCNANRYKYEVKITGRYRLRNLVYSRVTHSDLENASLNISRQDCCHLTIDQVHNFLRFKNKQCETQTPLEFEVGVHEIHENDDIPLDVN